jgi:hypothetical protein
VVETVRLVAQSSELILPEIERDAPLPFSALYTRKARGASNEKDAKAFIRIATTPEMISVWQSKRTTRY